MPAGRRKWLSRLGSLTADAVGALLFRKAPTRRLLRARVFTPFVAIIFISELLNAAFAPGASWSFLHWVLFAALAVLRTLFWSAAVPALLSPTLSLTLRLAEDDPLMLHWGKEQRREVRTACVAALSATLLLRGVVLAVVSPFGTASLLADFTSVPMGFLLASRMISAGWRYRFTTSMVLATGPALVATALAVGLTNPVTAAAISLLMLAPLWFFTDDIRVRRAAGRAVRELVASDSMDSTKLEQVIHMLQEAGDPEDAILLLERMEADGEAQVTSELKIRLLTAGERQFEAAEVGSAVLEQGQASAELHIALADACLRTDDPEDAAAHAEEAYERGGSLEALLLLAVACFGMGERDSGTTACRRILALARKGSGREHRKMVGEAKILLRNFGGTIH
jgi:hypothetical protein